MVRKLTWDLAVASLVFWVLITAFSGAGLSLEGFKSTFFQVLIFAMIYAAIRVAFIVFRDNGDK